MSALATTQAPADPRFGWRLRIGMMLPSVNAVAEGEVAAMLPAGVSLHTTRLKLAGDDPASLRRMADRVEEAAELLADADVDVVVFHCTAVSMIDIDMEHRLRERIEAATGRKATTTALALVAALRALGVRRPALTSPYAPRINAAEVAFLARFGIEVAADLGLDLRSAAAFASVEPGGWYRHARANQPASSDGHFLSCTAIRSALAIAPLERDSGLPVVTSNQAMTWHALRSGGVADHVAGFGKLFSLDLPDPAHHQRAADAA